MASGRRTARERVAVSWGRAESAVTKTALLGVFGLGLVAQFVPLVGDALEGKAFLGGALLSLVAFVLYGEVRGLKDALRPAVRDEVTTAELGEYFDRALAARKRDRRTRIDAVGFTGETVLYPISRSLEVLDVGARRAVTLRILVPDFTAEMAIPGMLDERGRAVDDPVFRAELLRKVQQYESTMKDLARRLRHQDRADLDAEFRVLRITPGLKFCLIDREELFDGIYDKLEERPAGTGPERQVLDLMGYHAILTRWHSASGAAGREKTTQRQDYFDMLWRVSSPLPSGSLPTGSAS
ncbi:hypothetical protein IPZ68_20545 [Streptomyces arenae]|nr:hypothetical protein [Streptomyces arenae]